MTQLKQDGNDADQSLVPLCVDLDGTLFRGDTFWETMLLMAWRHPLKLLGSPFWLRGGRAAFKARLSANVSPDDLEFSVNELLLEYLRREPRRPLYLVSGAHQAIVESVARRLPIFAGAFGSDEHTNLTGRAKAACLVAQFGEKGFDYAGNANVDLAVWAHARAAIVVNASKSLREKAEHRFTVEAVIAEKRGLPWREWLRCLRPHQWAINFLVFVPLFTLHLGNDSHFWGRAVLAFGAFCGVDGALAIFNDLFDLQSDRLHPHIRLRPLASGAVSVPSALLLLAASLVFGAVAAALASDAFVWLLMGYVVMSALYIFALKQVAVLGVTALGVLCTLRIIGGALVTGVALSNGFLIVSFLLFLSLGLGKRYANRSAL